ncbi:MAG: formylmethanofuran dehydrogenase subunit C [Candidatus Bathyarchaeum sp.]|nr:MAG: formylmethanofuran dehydrogenase subunit C [Candidatus Bathyarchaeum sp.]
MFKMITLVPLKEFQVPVTALCINPNIFEGKSVAEIAELSVHEGNRKKKLGDLFKIENDSVETPSITINGDVGNVKRIGMGMEKGEIVINGNAGMHLGEKMTGGKITVNGNADGWTGSAMKGGVIEIHGNASDYLASPYRGTSVGMRGGEIVVDGKVGSDCACYMKGGLLKIKGGAGPFLGYHMIKGTIYVEQECKTRVGASMTGGKIIVNANLEEVMPTFTVDAVKKKVKIDANEKATGPFYVFLGDLSEHGKGKLYVSQAANPQLSAIYDKYLE